GVNGSPGLDLPALETAKIASGYGIESSTARSADEVEAALQDAIADPGRKVVCVLGEGSVQYAVVAFWTAVAYKVPVTFVVLRNEEYAILKWFEEVESLKGSPGLDLPALETADIAAGYGITSVKAGTSAEVEAAIREALADPMPRLVEVPVQPGMSLF
ncbi:MAG: thiamine pyrophosphate-dependent enzyme, partial [Actinomycetota bacterium]|nr:thiamine pyrophosphate-dependent enzyme [Actinomycetota bacterium]